MFLKWEQFCPTPFWVHLTTSRDIFGYHSLREDAPGIVGRGQGYCSISYSTHDSSLQQKKNHLAKMSVVLRLSSPVFKECLEPQIPTLIYPSDTLCTRTDRDTAQPLLCWHPIHSIHHSVSTRLFHPKVACCGKINTGWSRKFSL